MQWHNDGKIWGNDIPDQQKCMRRTSLRQMEGARSVTDVKKSQTNVGSCTLSSFKASSDDAIKQAR